MSEQTPTQHQPTQEQPKQITIFDAIQQYISTSLSM